MRINKSFIALTSSDASVAWSNITGTPTTLSGYGITDGVPTSRTLTINGTTYDLSANRTWTVGTVTSVAITVPTGLTVSGSPITSSGTFAISLQSGYSIPTTASQTNWDAAYNDKINSAAVTGTTTKTLTLTQQDGGTVTASWTDSTGTGTVTSVAMTVPTGLTVSGSPITSSGTLALALQSGYSIPTTAKQTEWDTAYTNRITSLTTTGSSGAATLVSNTLNIPNYTLSGLGGVPTTRTLTINGTAFDLSADRSWSVGTVTSVGLSSSTSGVTIGSTPVTTSGTITLTIATASGSQQGLLSSTDWTTFNNKFTLPSLTSGSVLFSNGTTIAQDNANFFWDNTNKRLGIGTATPSSVLEVVGVSKFNVASGTTQANISEFRNSTNNGYHSIVGVGTSSAVATWTNGSIINEVVPAGSGNGIFGTFTGNLIFQTNNRTNRLTINSSGNLGLGVTPNTWTIGVVQQIGTTTALWNFSNTTYLSNNRYFDTSNKYIANGFATTYEQTSNGQHIWLIAPNNTSGAGAALTLTQAMTLTANGRLLLGTTTEGSELLQVNGTSRFTNNITIDDTGTAVLSAQGNVSTNFFINSRSTLTFQTGGAYGSSTTRMTIGSTGNVTISNLAGTVTRMVVADSSGVLSASTIVTSGTYTPTLTAVSNVASSSATTSMYNRIGNIVTVYGRFSATATASNTITRINISLPIASNLSSNDLVGFIQSAPSGVNGYIFDSSTVAEAYFVSIDTNSTTYYFNFQYRIV